MGELSFETRGGMQISRSLKRVDYTVAMTDLAAALDTKRGGLFSSSFEYPGRYTRWDIGFVNPPLVLTARGLQFDLIALNPRGELLLAFVKTFLEENESIDIEQANETSLHGLIKKREKVFREEDRSKQPSIFSVIRAIYDAFGTDEDSVLGLYGAFGYDLVFQFEQLKQVMSRADDSRDCVLYFPDSIIRVDHRKEVAEAIQYDFMWQHKSTVQLERTGVEEAPVLSPDVEPIRDHKVGEFAKAVVKAKEKFFRGDLFEVVLSQKFTDPCGSTPSELFLRLRKRNPAPYGFLINLGEQEYLVGASPEMFVCVQGRRVETCPISGTIKRGRDAIEDAKHIQQLLNSKKDESELSMCTDVDRNDKSRICEPGSVRVIGRRQIEMYARVIHTVDHVEGRLREGYDAIDAFLSHAWVVTVTGAPKLWAMQFVEDNERSPRAWYGGAVGWLGMNGDMNTGLTIRTIHVKDGKASVRVGATLLADSIPEDEEEETCLKASAMLDAIRRADNNEKPAHVWPTPAKSKRILLIDHQDSFVHTLANYWRQTGAEVETWRTGFALEDIEKFKPDGVVMSPGPGCPRDFDTIDTLAIIDRMNLPIFGVCLGLQALVEYHGGTLKQLDYPVHGKMDPVIHNAHPLFAGIEQPMQVGRYHSLYADASSLPGDLQVSAHSDDGIIMALSHKSKPHWAVQFHPESILSLHDNAGLQLIMNAAKLMFGSEQ